MKVSARFNYQQVDHEKDNTVQLLLTVVAPAVDWVAQRPTICVVPVLDLSGSMEGAKFEYAKQAIRKLIEQLKVGDYSGLITFGYRAEVAVPPGPVTPAFKTRLLEKLNGLRANGGTNFSDAITKSLSALGDLDLPPSIQQRAIFFTDGQPTTGVTDTGVIKGLLTQHLGSRSMSFFGYGDVQGKQCDPTFLTEMSDLGKGNYAYVQNPDDALAAFGRELGGLVSTYASDLRLVIEPRNGHTIDRVVTLLGPEQQIGTTDVTELSLELGDILAEEERHVVLECSVKKQDKALPRDFTIFNVKATCRRLTLEGERATEEAGAAARIRFVHPDEAQKTPTTEVDQIVALHQLAGAQREAEAHAARGHFAEAQGLLDGFSREARTRGHIGVASVAEGLGGRVRTKSLFASNQGYLKSMGLGLVRSAKVTSYEVSAQADLDSLSLGGGGTSGTSAQAAYSSLFTGNPAVPSPVSFVTPPQPVAIGEAWGQAGGVATGTPVATTSAAPPPMLIIPTQPPKKTANRP